MSEFGFSSTADEVLEGKDLSGRTALITGGYSGLGKETARAMAAKGAHIILSGRDAGKLDDAAREIADATGAKVETLVCDLASLESVRVAAKEANERFDKIDLLINNAGVMAPPLERTAEGFELQFGTNHVGHFLLTNLLMPLVEKGDRPRIVNLSSRGHHFDHVHFDDPNYEQRDYEKWAAYGQSKTANILFSVGLEQRLGDRGVATAASGGIQKSRPPHDRGDMTWMMNRIKDGGEGGEEPQGFKTIPQGTATTCWLPQPTSRKAQAAFIAKIAMSPTRMTRIRPAG